MFPRLAPRTTRRRSMPLNDDRSTIFSDEDLPDAPYIERQPLPPPMEPSSTFYSSDGAAPHSPKPQPGVLLAWAGRPALTNRENAPPPISPIPGLKSPLSSDSCSDFSYDFSLTPPAPGPRPLAVSAKRLGQDVRRKHGKRRRRRRRSNNAPASISNNHNQAVLGLWNDDPQKFSDSSDDSEQLPFLFASSQPLLSHQERKKHYWEWCYGKTTIELNPPPSWSASRAPPSRSCLSNPRPRRPPNLRAQLKTPLTSPEEGERLRLLLESGNSEKPKKSFRVQFGSPQAAEYEIDGPSAQLTPLPSDVTRKRYSMEQKVVPECEEELTEETKANSALLAEWEEGFDEPRASRGRRKNKNRRDSSLFTPSPDSSLLDSHDGDDGMGERTPRRIPLVTALSPSVVVMENLASLRMSPVNREEAMLSTLANDDHFDEDDGFILQNKVNSWLRTSDSNLSSPSPSVAAASAATNTSASDQSTVVTSPNHHGIAELVVNLQSIHSDGGAMDNTDTASPPARTLISSLTYDTQHAGETTPPSNDVSLDTIHTFGGALEKLESPIDLVKASPCFRSVCLAHKPEQENVSPLSNTSNRKSATNGALESAVHAEPIINVVQSILERPSSDQEWDCATVFSNLKRKSKIPIEVVLGSMGSLDGLVACGDDLLQKAKYQANTKAGLNSPSEKDPKILMKRVQNEWKTLELEFFENLICQMQLTGCSIADVRSDVTSLKLPDSIATPKLQRKLEQEIEQLEVKVENKRQELRKLHAAEAPFSALMCQASCQIAGFRIDEYTGDGLQISFEDFVKGVELRMVFDLNLGSLDMSVLTDASVSLRSSLSPSHPASKFHKHFLDILIARKLPLFKKIEALDLQETISTISLWLGRLDAATRDLKNVMDRFPVSVAMPTISISLPKDVSLELEYDALESSPNYFVPHIVTRSDTIQARDTESRSTAANYLQNLCDEICS